jgi:uroporphyrinogen decarboxylase
MPPNRKAAVIDAIRHKETPLLPYTLRLGSFVDGYEVDKRLDAWYGGPQWRDSLRNYIAFCPGADDGKLRPSPTGLQRDAYGTLWRMDRRPFHLEEAPLKTPSLRGWRFPDPDRLFLDDWGKRARAFLKENDDCFTVVTIGFGLFERAWSLRGFENFLADIAGEPEFAADLIAALAEHQLQLLDRVLDLPVDGMMFSDDWGGQQGVFIGPRRWRELLKPNVARLYARAKAKGKFVLTHCCGSITDILPDVIEIGLDVLESVQPEAQGMDPYELKDRFGGRLTFWGGIGSQSIVPHGTPAELRAEVRRLAAHMRRGGGYVLSTAKPLQPETPVENAVALLEEFIALGEARPVAPRRVKARG